MRIDKCTFMQMIAFQVNAAWKKNKSENESKGTEYYCLLIDVDFWQLSI